MNSQKETHISVMPEECIEGLQINPNGTYIDMTLGMGGHTERIAKKLKNGKVYAIDRDLDAIAFAKKRLAPYKDKVTLIHSNFSQLASIAEEQGIQGIDGILFDLGTSSYQLDTAERGFSYMQDAPLDMRMNREEALTAASIVNTWDDAALRDILYTYGEERYAPLIVKAILKARAVKPLETTAELVALIENALPQKALHDKGHPAKRVFQALRIAVNDELSILPDTFKTAIDLLKPGGRFVLLAFHSIEDRLCKLALKEASEGCTCPKSFPVCVCGKLPKVRILTKKPLSATEEELQENSRSKSAKLRIAEKL